MRGKFIVCEGVDGSGKTSCINYALQILSAGYKYNKGLILPDSSSRPDNLTCYFLREMERQDQEIIIPSLSTGTSVFQDRWYYSILTHHELNETETNFAQNIIPKLTSPDILIYFTVDLEERLKRLSFGAGNKYHREMIQYPDLVAEREARFMEYYSQFKGPKGIIDTSGKTVEESGELLLGLIRINYKK